MIKDLDSIIDRIESLGYILRPNIAWDCRAVNFKHANYNTPYLWIATYGYEIQKEDKTLLGAAQGLLDLMEQELEKHIKLQEYRLETAKRLQNEKRL